MVPSGWLDCRAPSSAVVMWCQDTMGFSLLHDQVPPLYVPSKPLLFRLDCTQVIQFSQAIYHFLALPVNRELGNYRLTDWEWSVLTDFEVVLEVWVSHNTTECALTCQSDSSPSTTNYVGRIYSNSCGGNSLLQNVHVSLGTTWHVASTTCALDRYRYGVRNTLLQVHGLYLFLYNCNV